ncbi:hypothetical protein CANINC_002176 [Pichia inconspicua]|uniref:Uncharacterized protein n=1 Tax=Pichia inconspicua TaxID=52247 RepID=A0A4T0X2B3_9ASCO|nr:hypothetical protein CANINC_002176 [[Candida] inconspicua]
MSGVEDFVRSQQDLLAKGVENLAVDDDLDYQHLDTEHHQYIQNQQLKPNQVSSTDLVAHPAQYSRSGPTRQFDKCHRGRTHRAFHDLQSPVPNQYVDHNIDPNAAAFNIGLATPQFASNFATPIQDSKIIPQQGIQFTPQNVHTPHQGQSHFDNNSRFVSMNNSHNINQDVIPEDLYVSNLRNQMNEYYKNTNFLSFEHVSAPPAGTQYHAIDQANAIPHFFKTTMYSVPESEELRAKTKIPLAIVLRPFAEYVPDYEVPMKVPEIKIEETQTVPRCRRCRAYLNPAMQHDIRNMTCNICDFVSPIPLDYVSTVDFQGVRDDYQTRPELHTGVVDYVVPKDYNLNTEVDNNSLHRVFLIDLTYNAYKSKLVESACSAIRLALYGNEGVTNISAGTKISIIGYGSNLYFYDLSPELEQATVSIVTDLEDPFIPFGQGIFANPIESYNIIEQTLTIIEQNGGTAAAEPAYGAALKAAGLVLEQVSGGQIISILSTLPSLGPGACAQRVKNGKSEVDFVKEICTAENKFYHDLSIEFVKNNIGVDLLVASSSNVDLINIGSLSVNTGGYVKEWLPFNVERDDVSFTFELKKCFERIAGYQCQLKIRCSRGLQVSHYYGPFVTTDGSGAPTIPLVSGETSIVADFQYDSKLDIKKDAHFQAAFLYTSKDGIRKVRVVNSILSITQRVNDVFDFADQDSILKVMIKKSIEKFSSAPIVALRSSLTIQCSEIMAAYKHYVANANNNNSSTQLILPQSLKTMPMMVLAILKSKAYRERVGLPDHRVFSMFKLSQSNLASLTAYLYPLLFCIHSLEENDFMKSEGTGMIEVGKSLPLTLTQLEYGGAYLLFNGERIIIWLHSDVNPLLLQDLFGSEVDSLEKVPSFIATLPVIDTHISKQVRNMCDYVAQHFNGLDRQSVEICRFKIDPNESEFQQSFIEEKNSELLYSYSDYLKEVNKQIITKGQSMRDIGSPKNDQDGENLSRRFGIF